MSGRGTGGVFGRRWGAALTRVGIIDNGAVITALERAEMDSEHAARDDLLA